MTTSMVARTRLADLRTFGLALSLFSAACLGEESVTDPGDPAPADARVEEEETDDPSSEHDAEPEPVVCPCTEDAAVEETPCEAPDAALEPDAEAPDAGAPEEDAGEPEDAGTELDGAADADAGSTLDAGELAADASNNMPWATLTYAPASVTAGLSLPAFNLTTRITATGEPYSEWIVMVRNDSERILCNVGLSASYYDAQGFERLRTTATVDAPFYREEAPYFYTNERPCIAPGETLPGWGPAVIPPGLALAEIENIYVSLSGSQAQPVASPFGKMAGYEITQVTNSTRAGNPYFRATVVQSVNGATLSSARLYPLNAGGMPLDRMAIEGNYIGYDGVTGERFFELMGNRKYTATSVASALRISLPPPQSGGYPYY